uniref:Uncharacterized protein n=1 Tax=Opuntia streptacantha TaxID=393608 RepID=A0A7C9DRI7_OPUST
MRPEFGIPLHQNLERSKYKHIPYTIKDLLLQMLLLQQIIASLPQLILAGIVYATSSPRCMQHYSYPQPAEDRDSWGPRLPTSCPHELAEFCYSRAYPCNFYILLFLFIALESSTCSI